MTYQIYSTEYARKSIEVAGKEEITVNNALRRNNVAMAKLLLALNRISSASTATASELRKMATNAIVAHVKE